MVHILSVITYIFWQFFSYESPSSKSPPYCTLLCKAATVIQQITYLLCQLSSLVSENRAFWKETAELEKEGSSSFCCLWVFCGFPAPHNFFWRSLLKCFLILHSSSFLWQEIQFAGFSTLTDTYIRHQLRPAVAISFKVYAPSQWDASLSQRSTLFSSSTEPELHGVLKFLSFNNSLLLPFFFRSKRVPTPCNCHLHNILKFSYYPWSYLVNKVILN